MGIYDRDYVRDPASRGRMGGALRTAVGTLIAINVAVWIVQLLSPDSLTSFLAASPEGLGRLRLWELFTAPFSHDRDSLFHVAFNMLFLYVFGREIEQIYGKRDFIVFYVLAGALSILAEVLFLWLQEARGQVLGASGAVMGLIVLYTLFFPTRQILFFFIPMPVWVLCALFIATDLTGLLGYGERGIARMAHLAGAGVGFLYWYFDVRTRRGSRGGGPLGRRIRRNPLRAWWARRKATRTSAQILQMPRPDDAATREISQRIDDLLLKISTRGKDSLSEEEWTFLRENSNRYRS